MAQRSVGAERKLGGILIETALLQPEAAERYLVIGIGINIGPREASGLSTAPAWLQEWRPLVTPIRGAARTRCRWCATS